MMKHVSGENRGKVVLYALSTCGWCERTKKFLNELGVEYSYVDVDLLEGKERESVINVVRHWNPRCSFPTIVVNEETSIVGYDTQKTRKAIGL